MKKTLNTRGWMFGLVAVAGAVGMGLPSSVTAEVSDADFNALKDMVQKLNEQVQSLRQTNQLNQQIHEQDLQQL